jgi:hypothetical protein
MVRRVSARAGGENLPNIFENLALLGNLREQDGENQNPLDLYGTSQEPENYANIVPTPQYSDVRQNENDYLENLRQIANMPLAISEDKDLRQDAQDHMRPMDEATLPFPIQEEQLEGLSGEMGQPHMIPNNKQGQLIDPLEVIRRSVEQDPQLLNDLPEETRNLLQQTPSNPEKPFIPPSTQAPEILQEEAPETPILPPETPVTQEMIEQYPNPEMKAGAVEQGFQNEQIASDLLDLAGGEIPEDQKLRAKQWQDVYTKRREELNAEERLLLQKAESGELSTFDKIALGIAIAIPILMTLRFGAGAGLTSAGKALEGFATAQIQQQKQNAEKSTQKSKRLEDISKERIGLEEKDIEMNKKILDSIPDKNARAFIKNKRLRAFPDGDIGISTGDEEDVLWLNGKKFDASDDGIKRAREVIKDADKTIGIMKDSNKTLNEVLEVIDQLPKNTGVWDAVKKNAQWFTSAGGANPFGGTAPKVKVKDENGKTREVDAFAVLKQKINVLQDLYNKQILGGTRLTGNVVTHWGGILGDPSNISSWLSQDLDSFKDTTNSLKNTMNSREIESLVGNGFLRQPLERAFPSNKENFVESEDNRVDRLRQTSVDELRKKVR